jgi:hypothetical protein
MKSLLLATLALLTISAQASENIELYHPEQPNASIAKRPGIPKLTAPAPLSQISGGDVTLQWNKVEDATAYALQVSPDPIFFTLLINEPLFKDTTYTIKDVKFEAGKNY